MGIIIVRNTITQLLDSLPTKQDVLSLLHISPYKVALLANHIEEFVVRRFSLPGCGFVSHTHQKNGAHWLVNSGLYGIFSGRMNE